MNDTLFERGENYCLFTDVTWVIKAPGGVILAIQFDHVNYAQKYEKLRIDSRDQKGCYTVIHTPGTEKHFALGRQ